MPTLRIGLFVFLMKDIEPKREHRETGKMFYKIINMD